MGIDRLSLEARVLYTVFCLFMLLGGASSAWLFKDDGLTASPSTTRRYYLGDDAPAPAAAAGPALDLPGEPSALPVSSSEGLRFEKPARQVVETFHFHLFSVPVCLLIVGHIFMMCALPSRTKVITLLLAALATFAHLLVPPLVRFASPAFALLMFPTGLVLTVAWTFLTAWPIFEMWRPATSGRPPSAP
jgi:hypothetical protein